MSFADSITSNSLIFNLVLGIILSVVPNVRSDFDPELVCTLVVDGTKMNDPRACNAWIECVDGKPVGGSCDDGFSYDRQSKSCLPSDDVNCLSSDPCAGVETGFAADPYSCNGYYYCKNSKGTRGECKEGYNFNPGTDSCLRGFPCTIGMDPDSICNILPDGVFIKDHTNCNGWQMCWKGRVIIDSCSDTFYFDAVHAKCDYPQNVECVHTEPPPLKAEPETCPQSGVFVSDKKSCHGYFYCRENPDGEMVLMPGTCKDNRFFSVANQGSCVAQEKIRCSYDRCVHFGFTHVELANLSDDGCRGYAICQDGRKIGTGTCPDGEYFDEVSQRCTNEVITYAACAKSEDDDEYL
ncbi:hypothetical protein ACLKA7_015385 [Drosophila subpalustris]